MYSVEKSYSLIFCNFKSNFIAIQFVATCFALCHWRSYDAAVQCMYKGIRFSFEVLLWLKVINSPTKETEKEQQQ